ncbi:hypothetical protein L2X98_24575 [Microbacterium elymi]|uniref:Branched-chain amino acid ABC transporter permease n=1 Tax=Microbacterium elymi TaxID=2909587 RepID=A0ABY5NM28_9MICO|nr:hypothetical protein [Microbacterium elymi]UUT36197.1 hypothetical protein L2X98_24575 [Microbacterium elymi]
MQAFLTYLLSGLALAGSFALVGSGMVVVYRVTHVLNFAQGMLAVFGAMISYTLLSGMLPHGVAELVAVICLRRDRRGHRHRRDRQARHAADDLAADHPRAGHDRRSGRGRDLGAEPGLAAGPRGSIQILGVNLASQRILVFLVALVTFALAEPVLRPDRHRQGADRGGIQPARGPAGRHQHPDDGARRLRDRRRARGPCRRAHRPDHGGVGVLGPSADPQRLRRRDLRRAAQARG